jgi:hypothetical protein
MTYKLARDNNALNKQNFTEEVKTGKRNKRFGIQKPVLSTV